MNTYDFFAWDRKECPTEFFTPIKLISSLTACPPGVGVVTPTNSYKESESREFGLVTYQTPFGQGPIPGYRFALHLFRPATPSEVLRAIGEDHPEGKNYRPQLSSLSGMSRQEYRRLMDNWEDIIERQVKAIEECFRR